MAVIVVALTTVNPVAALAPNFTAVAPVKLVPVIVTELPPAAGPWVGFSAVTVGAVDDRVIGDSLPVPAVGLVPAGVVTVMSTVVPAVPAGAVAVIVVALSTVNPSPRWRRTAPLSRR